MVYNVFEKFAYRFVYDRKKEGKTENLIQLEIYNPFNRRKVYCSTHVKVKQCEWDNHLKLVVGREDSGYLNSFLYKFKNESELIEMDYRLRNVRVSINMLKQDIKTKRKVSTGCSFYQFVETFIDEPSDRKKGTISNLKATLKSLKEYKNNVSFDMLDIEFVNGYEKWLLNKGIANNTIIKQMTIFKTFVNQAILKKYLHEDENPFKYYKGRAKTSKHRALTTNDIKKIEEYKPRRKHMEKIRDAFLFCTYTGFRYSDFVTLTNDCFSIDNEGVHWVKKCSVKTNITSSIPMTKLFNGKAVDIMEKYNWDIRKLNKIGNNSEVNKDLKEMYSDLNMKLDFPLSWHVSRHTFGTLLVEQGLPINVVSKMLGHTTVRMSETYCETTDKAIIAALER